MSGREWADKQYFSAASMALSGAGLGLHHTVSLWFVSALITGEVVLTQTTLSFVLPLLVQHWFVVTKYIDER